MNIIKVKCLSKINQKYAWFFTKLRLKIICVVFIFILTIIFTVLIIIYCIFFSFFFVICIFLFFDFILGILSISSIVSAQEENDNNNENNKNNDNYDNYDNNYDNNENDSDIDESNFDSNYISEIVDCTWFPNVDFVVENGPRGLIIDETSNLTKSPKTSNSKKKVSLLGGLSTIVDLTTGKPVVLRQGKGFIDVDSIST